MSNEELVVSYQSGNEEALEELIIKNTGTVHKIARKFYTENTSSIDYDDLLQEGTIGLMIAAKKYNPGVENKASFNTYAFYWVYQKIHRFLRYRNTNHETSINKPTTDDGELGDTIADNNDYIGQIEEAIDTKQLHDEIEAVMIECLTLKQRDIMYLYYGWDKQDVATMAEIAEILNEPIAIIRNNYIKAIRKIKATKWGRLKLLDRRKDSYNEILHKYDYNAVETLLEWKEHKWIISDMPEKKLKSTGKI